MSVLFLSLCSLCSHFLPFGIQKKRYEGDSICNEIALKTPPTYGLELYTIYGMKDQGFTFEWCIKLYSTSLTEKIWQAKEIMG